jgi:hypothetical protein
LREEELGRGGTVIVTFDLDLFVFLPEREVTLCLFEGVTFDAVAPTPLFLFGVGFGVGRCHAELVLVSSHSTSTSICSSSACAAAASSSFRLFLSSFSSFALASFLIPSFTMFANVCASPCTHASNTPSHSRVAPGKSRLRYTAFIGAGGGSSSIAGERLEESSLGVADPEDDSSLIEGAEVPRDLTAFENSLTILLVPGILKLVPTTNRKSAPLLPLPFDDPIKSFSTTFPTPSLSL